MHRVGARPGRARRRSSRRCWPSPSCAGRACGRTWPGPTSRTVSTTVTQLGRLDAAVGRAAARPATRRRSSTPPTPPGPWPGARPPVATWCGPGSPSTASRPGPSVAAAVRRAAAGAVAAGQGEPRAAGRRRARASRTATAWCSTARRPSPRCPLGYADGVPRRLSERGGEVLLGGRRRPIAGVVTMDQLMVDCGDDLVAPGRRGRADRRARATSEITADEWAERAGHHRLRDRLAG